ncbi:HCaRG protein [Tritrichomonas foetus]|uniref:HCaRG protein n=1 Tax=Tritrichomonas foetus TaxID=1144522 RepID=A0A1J4JM51_9EUKA|nr:HCaRG protein [Tritrichomonas foetus]|eukprot:OHS98348.1 HCaRG protein [Tritrichomonas foetus]
MTDQANALQEAMQTADKIPKRQFAQVLRRIAIALRTGNPTPFTEDDVQTLITSFEMTPSEFDAMFSACSYLLQQAACFSFDSEKILAYASQSGASEDISECFSAVWDAEGDDLIDSMKQKTIASKVLNNTAWRLDLKADEIGKAPMREPVLLFDLNIQNEKPLTIQFTHDELTQLYNQIEEIQQNIDKLT